MVAPRSFRILYVAAALMAGGGAARADVLATFGTPDDEIALMNDPCGPQDLQRAVKRAAGRQVDDGCWAVNDQGHPVVLWSDGTAQQLDQARVRLTEKYAAMLDDTPAPPRGEPASAPPQDFARPSWCERATFPHERLVCADRQLARDDLALAPLWTSYRAKLRLNDVQQGRVKSDYFRRLKACGSRKDCVAREQAAQTRLYREALARE